MTNVTPSRIKTFAENRNADNPKNEDNPLYSIP